MSNSIEDKKCIQCGEELVDEEELVTQICHDCFKANLSADYVEEDEEDSDESEDEEDFDEWEDEE